MIASIKFNSKTLKIDLNRPLDVSIPLRGGERNINAWYVDPPKIIPHKDGNFVGSVASGAPVNFNNIHFNPHSHVTHTETVGHISEQVHSVYAQLKTFFFLAELITVAPEKESDGFMISKKQVHYALGRKKRDAVLIRTLPNTSEKLTKNYSHTNPTYLHHEAAAYLQSVGVRHLLVDLPSVDKEKDGGVLLAHKAFWFDGELIREGATITEFIYVANTIADGTFVLNLQVAPFENDAAPSRPVLYEPINFKMKS